MTTQPNNIKEQIMNRKIRAALVAAMSAVAIFAINTSVANAGSYNITQVPCQGTGWIYGGFNIWPFSLSDSCSGSVVVDGSQAGGSPTGFAYWKSPSLPSTAHISGGTVLSLLRYTSSSHSAYIRSCYAYDSGWYGSCAGEVVGYGTIPSNTWGWYSVLPGATIRAIQVELARSEVGGAAAINALNLIATENTAPSVSREVGGIHTWFDPGQWNPNAWHRGVKNFRTTASDSNGLGIRQQDILIDGGSLNGGVTLTKTAAQLGCSFGTWLPCPQSAPWVISWDSAATSGGVLDGSHTVTFNATDAANNSGALGSYGFKIDNTDPDSPSSANGNGDGLQGYGATNDFDISWTNGAETTETATQSGISHVVLDLQPVNPGGSNPAPLVVPVGGSASGVSATIDSLSGVTLPEQAGYRYGVGVRDLAGNWSGNVSVDGSNNPTGVSIDPEDSSALTWNSTPPVPPDPISNGWVSEADLLAGYSQQWSVTVPLGGSAICGYATSVSANQTDDPGTTINLHGAVESWELPSDLSEGTHYVHIRSIGCNLLPAASTASSEVKVDRTDPVSSFAGVTAGRWYKDGSVVTIGATDALSGMEPAPSDQEFDKGAHLDYSINAVSPAEPARGGEAQLPVSGEGQKELRFAAVDLAGNRNDDTVVDFGIDASDPTGYLEATDPDTPTLIRAPLADAVSGLETAIIEIRPEGGGDWTPLATGLADLSGAAVAGNPTSAMASARFPDTTLPEGRYLGRVRTYDQAENSLVTDRDKQGRRFIVDSGSMREHVGLSATLFKAKRTCKKKKGVKCIKKARGKVVFLGGKSSLTVGFKRGAVVQGFLVDASTKALARQPIEIYTQTKGKEEVLAGTTSTRPDGSYSFKLRPGVSRSVRVYFPGTETRRDTSERVTLGTGAKLKLRVSKKHARTGQTVIFSGTVTSFDGAVPASGKIIALQFYTAKKWRPAVAIARTDSRGRFKVKYKFDGGGNKARIVFRVMAPAEDGWGHTTSNSRRITMKLN